MNSLFPIYIALSLINWNKSTCLPITEDLCIKEYDNNIKRDVYTSADVLPQFPDGPEALYSYIKKNQPASVEQDMLKSIVIQFIIDVDGAVINEKIKDRTSGNYTNVEKNIIMKLRLMPKWTPGKCNGKNVPFLYSIIMHICMSA